MALDSGEEGLVVCARSVFMQSIRSCEREDDEDQQDPAHKFPKGQRKSGYCYGQYLCQVKHHDVPLHSVPVGGTWSSS